MTREDYNAEPVHFCRRCLSLRILVVPKVEDFCYCDDCASTDTGQCSIEEWEKMYRERYGYSLLNI